MLTAIHAVATSAIQPTKGLMRESFMVDAGTEDLVAPFNTGPRRSAAHPTMPASSGR
jgi:hypothetical protein